MDMCELPPFWLAYLNDPSDSGRIHSNIRQRWLSGRLRSWDSEKKTQNRLMTEATVYSFVSYSCSAIANLTVIVFPQVSLL